MNTTTNQASGVTEPDDEQINAAIIRAVRSNQISWTGYDRDGDGKYTIPSVNPFQRKLVRLGAALATKPAAPAEVVATDFSTWFDENEHLMTGRGYTPRDIAMFGWHASLRTPTQAPSTGAVYLVATGEVVDGQETYTRHEGAPPPLCDFERLYASPPVVLPASPAVEVASEYDERDRERLDRDSERLWLELSTPPAAASSTEPASAVHHKTWTHVWIALSDVPCKCSPNRREEGRHLSGCNLFDLSAALHEAEALATPTPAVAVPGSLTDEDALRDALQQMVDAFSAFAWGSSDSKRDALNNAERTLATTSTAAQPSSGVEP